MSLIVALGMGFLAAGLIWSGLVFPFAACIKVILNLTVGIIYLLSQLPAAYFYIHNVFLWEVMIYYILVIGIFYWVFWSGRRLTK